MKQGNRKSSNVKDDTSKKPQETIRRPHQFGSFRDKKYSRAVPGGVQGAESTSHALMGKSMATAMESAGQRDKISDVQRRIDSAKKTIEGLKKRNGPNPFDKARSK